MKSKIKWAAVAGFLLSFVSLLVHLFLAKSTANFVQYGGKSPFVDDLYKKGPGHWRLWGEIKALKAIHPYANPRTEYPAPNLENNGFIYAKVFGGFDKIRNSICDLVTISRLLNATLVIPELQQSLRSKGISSMFKSFSYIYDEEKFIAALANDVMIVTDLPQVLKDGRKKKKFPILRPEVTASPSYYFNEILPKLKKAKVIGLTITDGGCLQPILPHSLAEYQRLRCRVAFDALHFRTEVLALGNLMVERLQASGQPYLAYHPGLNKDTLAYHGCAELFQDIHSELILYRRKQLIKLGIISEELSVDSYARKGNGSCPLMPEEVGVILRAMGYPPRTRIYVAGSETFGGQRVLIPFRAMYANLVDRTSLCSKEELAKVVGPETPLPPDPLETLPAKSVQQQKDEWDKAGPRPRPLPPPPNRAIYRHELEGWYGWIGQNDTESPPRPSDLRDQAHRLLWDALDYIVSVEANAFFPGFDNDGSGWPDFSSLVMGHRVYKMASARTYRPNRKYLTELLNSTSNHLYYPPRNFTLSVKDHLNKSLAEEGLIQEFHLAKKRSSFLSHPIPECSCTLLLKTADFGKKDSSSSSSSYHNKFYAEQDKCPTWLEESVVIKDRAQETSHEDIESSSSQESEKDDSEEQFESEGNGEISGGGVSSLEQQDEEIDPDD